MSNSRPEMSGTTHNTLAIGLILALCSNAVLLLLLLLQMRSGVGTSGGVDSSCGGLDLTVAIGEPGSIVNALDSPANSKLLAELLQDANVLRNDEQPHIGMGTRSEMAASSDGSSGRKGSTSPALLSRLAVYTLLRKRLTTPPASPQHSGLRSNSIHNKERLNSNHVEVSKRQNSSAAFRYVSRKKRASSRKKTKNRNPVQSDLVDFLFNAFVSFTDKDLKKLPTSVSKLLMPALIEFESLVGKRLTRLNDILLDHNRRLEEIHAALLDDPSKKKKKKDKRKKKKVRGSKFGLESLVIDEDLIPGEFLEEDEGSGEAEVKIRQPRTTVAPSTYAQLYQLMMQLEQKVLGLENYNIMASSELTRTRSEVIKMDDKVTEFQRRQRNLATRTSNQRAKITDLETFKAKAELTLETTLSSFSRMSQRLGAFKDRLNQYTSELHTVTVQFDKQNQISAELRSADGRKAHDISDLRGTVLSMAARLNDVYLAMDQNAEVMRADIRGVVDGICVANRLAC